MPDTFLSVFDLGLYFLAQAGSSVFFPIGSELQSHKNRPQQREKMLFIYLMHWYNKIIILRSFWYYGIGMIMQGPVLF